VNVESVVVVTYFFSVMLLLLGNAGGPGSHPHTDRADHKDMLANERLPQGDRFA